MADPTLPRRTAVGLGVGLLGGGLAAGCGGPGGGSPGLSATPATTPATTPAVTPSSDPAVVDSAVVDSAVVDRARAELAAAESLVLRTMRRHPALRPRLRPALALHRRHDELLSPSGGGEPDPVSGPAVPDDLAAARALVLRRERALQGALTGLALEARSGPLARVLAGLAAGTAQRVVLLERA